VLGFTVAVRIEARLHQLGDAAIRVAHRGMDALELFRAMDELGSGQPQFGKFALQDEFHRSGFVIPEPAQLVNLGRTLMGGRMRGRGRGRFRLRPRLRFLSGRLVARLVARPLE
jgi:hypothetical protein